MHTVYEDHEKHMYISHEKQESIFVTFSTRNQSLTFFPCLIDNLTSIMGLKIEKLSQHFLITKYK